MSTAFDEVEGGVDELGIKGLRNGGKARVGCIVLVVVPVGMGLVMVMLGRGWRWTSPLRNGSSRGLVLRGGVVEK